MNLFKNEFEEALVNYEKTRAFSLFEKFVRENETAKFIDEIIVEILSSIGNKWHKGNLSLSQVYLSSKICEEIIAKLLPAQPTAPKNSRKTGIVTLEDHHILGKRIVSSTLRSSGFNLIDFGHGISVERMLEKIISEKPEILLISVLMYPSALKVKKLRDELLKNNIEIKILVGGAPFNFDKNLWEKVGADAMGRNATDAVKMLEKWMEAKS